MCHHLAVALKALRPEIIDRVTAASPMPVLHLFGPDESGLPASHDHVLRHGAGEPRRLLALGAILRRCGGEALAPDQGAAHVLAATGARCRVVFGAQDGILSTVALVTSVAVAVGNNATVLVAGLAAALAGMLSMATGAYLGSRAEQDVQRAEIAREALELEEKPEEEFAELVVIFQREGKTYEEARQLADEIAQDKELWLNTLIEKELGISPEDTTNPIKDALVMGTSFILAAVIPIIPYLIWSGPTAIGVSVAAALVGLFLLGMSKGRLVQRSPILQGLEILLIGAVSAGIGFLLGEGIPRLFI